MENSTQRTAFLNGEGDAWFNRNANYEIDQFDHVDKEILQHLSRESNILEIGCADGRRLARIQKVLGTDSRLVGIDPSTAAIQQGLIKFQGLDLRIGTADDLPLNEFFSTVILGFCLYLCDRTLLSKIVSEVDKVLLDNGTLIIVDFDPPHPRRCQYRHQKVFGVIKWTTPHYLRHSRISVKVLKNPCRIKSLNGKSLKRKELQFGC